MHNPLYKLPFRVVLTLPFLIVILVAVSLTGYISFQNGQKSVNEIESNFSQERISRVQQHLDNYLATPHLINQLNLDSIQLGQLNVQDPNALEHHFVTQIKNFPSVVSIAYASEQKEYIGSMLNVMGYAQSILVSNLNTGFALVGFSIDSQGNNIMQGAYSDYDPRSRIWYQSAVQSGKEVWTPIFMWLLGQVGMDAVVPVYNNAGKLLGVLDTSLTLDGIGDFLQNLTDSLQGHTFILEPSGLLVAASTIKEPYTRTGDELNRLSAFECNDPIVRAAALYLQQQPGKLEGIHFSRQFHFNVQGDRQFAQVTPYQGRYGLDWLIVTVIPESAYMGNINTNNRTTALLILVALLASIFITTRISHWVIHPIMQLNLSSRALSQGNWTQKVVIDRGDEIGELANSFNHMAEQLQAGFAKMQDEEARYHTLFEDSPIPLLELDFSDIKKYIDDLRSKGIVDWKSYFEDHPEEMCNCAEMLIIKDVNRMTLKFLNVENKIDLLTNLPQIYLEKFYALFKEVLISLAKDTNDFEQEVVYLTSQGEEIYLSCKYNVVPGYGDNWSKLFISLADITKCKQAEKQMRKLSQGIEQSPVSIVITDTNGAIEYVNPKFTELTGYSLEEVLGRNPSILKSGRTPLEEYVRLWNTITSGREWKGEFCNVKKNGEYYWEMASISPVVDEKGKITNFVAVKEDITERKRTETALIESENRYRSVVNQAREGIMLVDEDGYIVTWNRALEKITDFAAQDMLGCYVWDVHGLFFSEEQIQKYSYDDYRTMMLNFLKTGQSPLANQTFERTYKHPTGSQKIVEGHVSAIHTDKGFILVVVIQDITGSKNLEINLQRYANRMEILHKIDQSILASHSPEQIANSTLRGLEFLISDADVEIVQFELPTHQISRLASTCDKLQFGDYKPIDWALVEELRHGNPLLIKKYCERDELSLLSIPLQIKGELIGAINLFGDAATIHTMDNILITREIADQIGIAIQQSQMQAEASNAKENLLIAYDTTIEGWAKALEMRDMETEGHSQRVVDMTLAIAVRMGFEGEELVHIRRGALLHDIGKMGIPDSILRKPNPLDVAEWEIMRQHTQLAYDLLSSIEFLQPALAIPYYHHEQWNGGGYPRGLRGEEIPLEARIFAIVDVWDALTNERVYRNALSKEQTIEYIKDNAGLHFDPKVVDVFLKYLFQITP
jgi:PAS domain S-box-containing protein